MSAIREAGGPAEGVGSLAQLAIAILRELPGMISDRVRLLALELQSASMAVAWLIVVAVAGGVLLSTAWLALWVIIAMELADAGLDRLWVAGIVIAVNLVAAAALLLLARDLIGRVTLPATLRRLTSEPPRETAAEPATPPTA